MPLIDINSCWARTVGVWPTRRDSSWPARSVCPLSPKFVQRKTLVKGTRSVGAGSMASTYQNRCPKNKKWLRSCCCFTETCSRNNPHSSREDKVKSECTAFSMTMVRGVGTSRKLTWCRVNKNKNKNENKKQETLGPAVVVASPTRGHFFFFLFLLPSIFVLFHKSGMMRWHLEVQVHL